MELMIMISDTAVAITERLAARLEQPRQMQ